MQEMERIVEVRQRYMRELTTLADRQRTLMFKIRQMMPIRRRSSDADLEKQLSAKPVENGDKATHSSVGEPQR